jgi:hypothetical protein
MADETEVCAVRVGSAGSATYEIAKEFASTSEKLARSLQNLHRGFDSRRRLSFGANREFQSPSAEIPFQLLVVPATDDFMKQSS